MGDLNDRGYTCPRCTVGRCHYQTTTFIEIYKGQLLCVSDVPVYVCDVCHFAEFELNEIESLWAQLDDDPFVGDL